MMWQQLPKRLVCLTVGLAAMLPVFGGACQPLSGYWGQNVNINLTIPLGLDGGPGLLNWVGLLRTTTGETAGTSAGQASPPAAAGVDPALLVG